MYWMKWKDFREATHKTGGRKLFYTTRRGLCFTVGTTGVMGISSLEGQHKSNFRYINLRQINQKGGWASLAPGRYMA